MKWEIEGKESSIEYFKIISLRSDCRTREDQGIAFGNLKTVINMTSSTNYEICITARNSARKDLSDETCFKTGTGEFY